MSRPGDDAFERVAVTTVPLLFTLTGAAHVLGCSTRTVRRRIADGSLPAVLEHDRLMVRGDDLRDYVDGLTRPQGTPRARPRRVERQHVRVSRG